MTPVPQWMYCEVKSCVFVRSKTINNALMSIHHFWPKYGSIILKTFSQENVHPLLSSHIKNPPTYLVRTVLLVNGASFVHISLLNLMRLLFYFIMNRGHIFCPGATAQSLKQLDTFVHYKHTSFHFTRFTINRLEGCGFESRPRLELSTTEVRPLSKASNPQLLPGVRSDGLLPTAPSVCAHLNGLNAENILMFSEVYRLW